MFICISDRYDHNAGTYESVNDFRCMCLTCFDEEPMLVEQADGWHDRYGLVLVDMDPVCNAARVWAETDDDGEEGHKALVALVDAARDATDLVSERTVLRIIGADAAGAIRDLL